MTLSCSTTPRNDVHQDAGVKVKVQRYDRTYHGFLSQVGVLPEAIDAMQTIGAFLRAYDSSPVPPVPK